MYINVHPFSLAPSMPPQAFSAVALNSTSINVTWADIPVDSQHGTIIKCHLQWNEENGDQEQTFEIPIEPRVQILIGMKKYTKYQVQVACSTSAGISPYASTSVTTQEDGKIY